MEGGLRLGGNTNKVICGGENITLDDVADRTIPEIRGKLTEILNITDEHKVVLVNGRKIKDPASYKLAPGDEVEFVKPSGQKG